MLPWLTDRRREPLRGAAAFVAALEEQASDWRRIRSMEPEAGFCVAGDLNQDLLPSGHYYGSVAGRAALRQALTQARMTCLTAGESDPVARLGGGRASIDHLCIAGVPTWSGASRVTVWPRPEQLGGRLTDHFGVAADIFDL